MTNEGSISNRRFLGWLAMAIGGALGGLLAEACWRATHPCGVRTFGLPPERGIDYWLMAASFTLSGAVLGLALAHWRDLPTE